MQIQGKCEDGETSRIKNGIEHKLKINGEKKIVLCCLLLIKFKKIVILSWELRKSLIMKKNHSPANGSYAYSDVLLWALAT